METYKIKNVAGHLAKGFLANPLTPILAFAILLLGYISLEIMPREEDPQIAVSGGAIIVAIPGATPQEISNVIIKPLERRIREIKGVDNIYGTAMNNFGIHNPCTLHLSFFGYQRPLYLLHQEKQRKLRE